MSLPSCFSRPRSSCYSRAGGLPRYRRSKRSNLPRRPRDGLGQTPQGSPYPRPDYASVESSLEPLSGHACCEKIPSDRIGCCGNAGQTATFIRPDDTFLQTLGLTDNEAAERVIRHFINRHNDPRQTDAEKHLKRLVCSPLLRKDDVRKVLRCADDLFFEGLLRLNVTFVWSERFIGEVDLRAVPDLDIIGTTQIRQEKDRTFRARIVLSSSMLQNPAYDRRLVLSAVLHEAIHAYLFVRLGLAAKCDNGHTEGFLTIAGVIDEWFDGCGGHPGYLRLLHAEADLECFVARNGCGWDPSKQAWR